MFEDLFEKARQKMTTDKAAEDCGLTKDTKIRLSQIKDLGCVKDAKMQIGAISHRKDGDYRKVAEGKFVPVKMPGKGGANKSAAPTPAEKSNTTQPKGKNDAYLDNKGLQAIYRDIKSNGLEHFDADRIAKEYKITKGDAEKIKAIMNVVEPKKESKKPASRMDQWLSEDPSKLSDKDLMEKNETLQDFGKSAKGDDFKKVMNAGIAVENELKKRKLPSNPGGIGYKEEKEKSLNKSATPSPSAENKTFTFMKAGKVYRVPASSPAEAVTKLKEKGVRGFKESDAVDNSQARREPAAMTQIMTN